jgi:hypothetical protein
MASVPNLTLAQCLARSNKVTLSGTRTTQYRDSSGASDKTYDFRGLTSNMLDAYNVIIGNGSAGTSNTYRPAIIGSVQDATNRPTFAANNLQGANLGWRSAYNNNGDCLFVRAEDWAIISGYRSRDADDAISIRSNGHRRTFFRIEHCLIENCYDDSVEDDSLEPGIMYDCLVDGTGVFLSQRLDASDPFSTPRTTADVFTVDSCLVRLRQMTGWDPNPSLLANHILWKMDGNLSCRINAVNSVFVVPGPSVYGTGAMVWPSGMTCTNCILLYGGGGPYPQPLPAGVTQYHTGTTPSYATALTTVWAARRTDWLIRHGLQTGTPSTSTAALDVVPSSGQVPLSTTMDASASLNVSGTNPYVFDPGDGSGAYAAQAAATKAHTYSTAGTWTARVTTQPGSSTATDTVVATAVPSPPAPELRYSTSADRSAPAGLSAAILKATRYVFVGLDTGIASVRWFLNDPGKTQPAYSTDTSSPFDLVPGSSSTVTYQGTATSATTGSGTATSLAVPYPASVQANEVLVACVCNRTGNQAPIIGPGGGWLEAPSSPVYKGNSIALSVWYKIATGSESGSATWTTLFNGNPVATKIAGAMARFSGVDTANPFNASGSVAEGATPTTTHTTPSVTTTTANCMLVELFSDRGTSTWTPPTGNSETERIDVTTTGTADVSLELVTSGLVAAGAYQKTATATASSQYACMGLWALKPASTGTATGLDTTALTDGFHELLAECTFDGDAVVDVGARFQVQNTAYALQASYTSDRKLPFALAGATISGLVYVFLQPDADVARVDWWRDDPAMTGEPTHADPGRPFDLIGSDAALGNAFPWDTAGLAGPHSISVRVTAADAGLSDVLSDALEGATSTLTTNFTVGISRFIAEAHATVSAPLTSQVDVPVPAAGLLQPGDVLLATVANRSGLAISLPAGWAHATASPVDYGTSIHLAVAWRPVTDPTAEPASYTFDLGGGAATTQWTGAISAWRGISAAAPFHAAAQALETEDLTAHLTAEVTPTETGCWLVTVAVERLTEATPTGLSSTDLERLDIATTPPGAITLAVYDSNAGVPTGSAVSRTITSANISRYVVSWIAALRPSTTGGTEWDVGWVQLGGGGVPPATSDRVTNVVKNSF